MTNRKRSVWPWIVGTLVVLPIAYALSIGPVFWLTQKICGFITPAVNACYMPLFWVLEHDPTECLAPAFFWYITRWGEFIS